jgi:hypothetical protein
MSGSDYASTTPTMVIDAPLNYEHTHYLAKCPLCNRPDPFMDMYLPVREFHYFDTCLYTCDTVCECEFGAYHDPIDDSVEIKPHNHKFSVKQELLFDSNHLKIYDRTHQKGAW